MWHLRLPLPLADYVWGVRIAVILLRCLALRVCLLETCCFFFPGIMLKKRRTNDRVAKSAVANRSTKYTQQSASKGIYSYLLVSKGKGRYWKVYSPYLLVSVRIVSVHWNASIRWHSHLSAMIRYYPQLKVCASCKRIKNLGPALIFLRTTAVWSETLRKNTYVCVWLGHYRT